MRRAGIAAVLIFGVAPVLVAQSYEVLMEKGDGADLRGKTKKAAQRYEAAIAAAATPEQRVDARLAYADAVRGAQPNKDLDAETAADLEDAYKRAIAEAKDKDSFKAHNDYGVFLLDRGNATGAVAVLTEGEKDLGAVEDITASRYLSNLGLAQYRAGLFDDALRAYRSAIEKDPAFPVPAVAAYTVIGSFEPQRGAQESVSLVELLMKVNRLGLARTFIEKTFATEAWHAETAPMARMVEVLVSWLVRTKATPEEIAKEWLPQLEHLRDELSPALNADAREKVEQLILVYEGSDLPMGFNRDVARHFSRWVNPEDRTNIALLLRQSADDAASKNEPKRAAERYIAAWELDRQNVDALTYMADLLSSWEDEESAKLFDGLINALFDAKGAAISSSDDAAALRLHMVLGSIFETREQWGPRHDPRTALYQYEAALRAYERLRGKGMETRYPGVHANLAAALKHTDDSAGAWSEYVRAADANLANGDVVAASLMLDRCAEVSYQPTEEQLTWVKTIADAVAAKTAAAPVTDADISELVRDRLSADPEVDASAINVSVQQGVVHLSGEATSQHQIDEAVLSALKSDGVKEVKAEVDVPPPDR
jgi:tetratricopeptide (TPR) repeat protein